MLIKHFYSILRAVKLKGLDWTGHNSSDRGSKICIQNCGMKISYTAATLRRNI
jgi:hypothetical protein